MPLDVIMPALGMAQDTGQIVAWHKSPGDPVAKGDVLFEVETDKSTVEVEANGDGFLTDVVAEAGEDVPVGNVIAKISDSAESSAPPAEKPAAEAPAASAPADDLPKGKAVIMPTLGMSQDTGLLVNWNKAAGEAVSADDVLFEVETDKSTNEVTAGHDGYVAALLAEPGDDVPTGQTIAIISAEPVDNPITRPMSAAPAAEAAAPEPAEEPREEKPASAPKKSAAAPSTDGRILASPKLRRVAREQGLDLGRLVKAGHPQPFHMSDLDALKALPDETSTSGAPAMAASRITAHVPREGFTEFANWAADTADLKDASALLAGLLTASLGREAIVEVTSFDTARVFAASATLSATEPSEDAPDLRLRDLRFSTITSVQIGAEDIPAITLTRAGDGFDVTLEYGGGQLSPNEALALLSNFAGRLEQPLRHLL